MTAVQNSPGILKYLGSFTLAPEFKCNYNVTKETKRIRIKDKLSTELRSDIAINYFARLPAPERPELFLRLSRETSEKLKLCATRGRRVHFRQVKNESRN